MLPPRTVWVALVALVAAFLSRVIAVPAHDRVYAATRSAAGAPLAPLVVGGDEPVEHHYMIVLKDGVSSVDFLAHRELINQLALANVPEMHVEADFRHIFEDPALQGYAGRFSPDALTFIRAQPQVAYVEADSVVRVAALPQGDEYVSEMPPTPAQAASMPWDSPFDHLTEVGAPWGLARISHRASLSLGTFNKYVYERVGGEGVTAYIIDTGINVDHEDFGGRARWGKTMPANDEDVDGHGHGTHVAGTIGSETYGVAKRAELVAVKVLGSSGQGSMSDVTAGVLWAVADARERTREMRENPTSPAARRHRGFVANMSLGGMLSPTLERAVDGAVAAGLHFAVAAGNENQDACDVSPANARNPVTVAASTIADERAFFSNKGKCVDIFAPGLNIQSVWNTSPRSINTLSGTSMATPHIVGLMAYMLSIYGSSDFALLSDAANGASPRWASWLRMALAFVPAPLRPLSLLPTAPAVGVSQPLSVDSALRPRQLKNALARFASHGLLADLEPETVNLLAFNNATRI